MVKRYLSDDGQSVTVVHSNGEEEYLSVEEFEEDYGFSPLEEENSVSWEALADEEADAYDIQAEILTPEDLYWERFDDLCDTVGRIMAYKAIIRNDEDGVYPVQQAVHNYFDHDLLHVDQSIAMAQAHARKVLRDFEQVGISLGLKPISERGKYLVKRFLTIRERRQYVRDWGRKYAERGEIVDIGELMRQSYRKQRSLWPESWKKDGCPF